MVLNNRILVIEDDLETQKSYAAIFAPKMSRTQQLLGYQSSTDHTSKYQVAMASQGEEGVTKVQKAVQNGEPYVLAFIDMLMPPGIDGLEAARQIRAIDPKIYIVIVTAYSDRSTQEIDDALQQNILFLRKPFERDEILQLARNFSRAWDRDHQLTQSLQALQASEKKYHDLFEGSTDALLIVHPLDGHILDCNAAALSKFDVFSVQSLGEQRLGQLSPIHQADGAVSNTCFQTHLKEALFNHHTSFEWQFSGVSGRRFLASVVIVSMELGDETVLRVAIRDISALKALELENKRYEQRMQEQSRLASSQNILGAMAHELNNALTPAFVNIDMLKVTLGPYHAARSMVDALAEATRTISQLCKKMRLYSGDVQIHHPQDMDVMALWQNSAGLQHMQSFPLVQVNLICEESLPHVRMDEALVVQALQQLLHNGAESMEGHGEITVAMRKVNIKQPMIDRSVFPCDEATPGDYLKIEVTDSGCGIAANLQGKIFEPFYTTHFHGRGLGLGLVLSIVHAHHGLLMFESTEGLGTTMSIFLPLFSNQGGTVYAPRAVEGDAVSHQAKNHRILVVDDDEMVRDVLKLVLGDLGYEVVMATNGQEGLELYAATPDLDGVILDMMMPVMTGDQCFKGLKEINPHVKVVLSSGYCDANLLRESDWSGLAGMLEKPYHMKSLKQTVENVFGVVDHSKLNRS
ncbi:MAG: response regulator [Zetaproteobacteria bacterium]|nr:response regulator [Zetaproteobacteria bacterium]